MHVCLRLTLYVLLAENLEPQNWEKGAALACWMEQLFNKFEKRINSRPNSFCHQKELKKELLVLYTIGVIL